MNPDFVDLLRAFAAADVRFLVVGAYALAFHGRPRATGDLDVWVEASKQNAPRVMRALTAFGAPLLDVSETDFAREGITYQMGLPPGRIDILAVDRTCLRRGLARSRARPFRGCRRRLHRPRRLHPATGRSKDLGDIEALG
jgi:hypothetical protein